MTAKPWTKFNDADLRALTRELLPIKEIAQRLDRSVSEVELRLAELGASVRGAIKVKEPANKAAQRRSRNV